MLNLIPPRTTPKGLAISLSVHCWHKQSVSLAAVPEVSASLWMCGSQRTAWGSETQGHGSTEKSFDSHRLGLLQRTLKNGGRECGGGSYLRLFPTSLLTPTALGQAKASWGKAIWAAQSFLHLFVLQQPASVVGQPLLNLNNRALVS